MPDPAATPEASVKPRVFVSHSSGKDAAAVEQLTAIVAELERVGYDTLVDKRDITSGAEWREYIHAWLAECDAAVILFSKRAVEDSKWVLKEATILSWRETQDRAFKLFPVCLPDIESKAIESGAFAPLELKRLQAIKSGNPIEIAKEVQRELGPGRRLDSPMDRLVAEIAARLRSIDPLVLEDACKTQFGHVKWKPGEQRPVTLAYQLAKRMFSTERDLLDRAICIFESIGTLDRENAERILAALEPLWVEPDAAGHIPVSRRAPPARPVALKAKRAFDFTAALYLARAYPQSTLPLTVYVDAAHDGRVAEHTVAEIRETVRKRQPPRRGLGARRSRESDADVDALVKAHSPAFVVLPQIPDPQSLAALRAAYDNVTYVCCTDRLPPPASVPEGLTLLVPELDAADEDRAWLDNQKAWLYVGRRWPSDSGER